MRWESKKENYTILLIYFEFILIVVLYWIKYEGIITKKWIKVRGIFYELK